MKSLRATSYFAREALANLGRHPLYSGVGIMTLAVSLIMVGFLGLFVWKAHGLVDRMAGGLTLTVYLEPGVDASAADELSTVISSQWEEVESVSFMTEEQDRERNIKLLPAVLMDELTPEMVPGQPTLEIELKVEKLTEARVDALVKWFTSLENVRGVDQVLFGAEKIAAAFSLLQGARKLLAFISVVLVLAALFFVMTTTRLIVEGRRKEIEVLLLVGATPGFIRIPHYLEGALQGLLSGALAYFCVWLLQRNLLSTLRSDVLLQVPVDLLPFGVVVWFLLGGLALGLAGSAIGLARYLRMTR